MVNGRSTVLSVSQLNFYVKSVLDGDSKLRQFLIRGEISNFTHHARSGHFYFTLKDEKSAVKAVMFQTYASKVKFRPQNGMRVVAVCSLSVYERDGVYQLYVYDLMPEGVGALNLAFEQLKEKLEREGIFDDAVKKPIPSFPKAVGVITSENGAALQDILNILSRRNPLVTVRLAPVQVQGEDAHLGMIKALRRLDQDGSCDVIILGRGGGSIEDLWAFNSEALAYAIYECETPVISAVGHETDYTISDFAADLRAPTPSAAAELCSVDVGEWTASLKYSWYSTGERLLARLSREEERLSALKDRLELGSPAYRVNRDAAAVEVYRDRITAAMERKLQNIKEKTASAAALLEAYSPLKVLGRGYTIVEKEGRAVADGMTLVPGDSVTLHMRDALVRATVDSVGQNGDFDERECPEK